MFRYLRVAILRSALGEEILSFGGFGDPPSRASVLVALLNPVAIGLAVAGARWGTPKPPAALFMGLLALFWSAVYVPFYTVVRYAYPHYALLFVFAAAGAVVLAARARRDARSTVPVGEGARVA